MLSAIADLRRTSLELDFGEMALVPEFGSGKTPNLTYSVSGIHDYDPQSHIPDLSGDNINAGFGDYDVDSPDFTKFIPYPGELRHVPLWEVVVKILFYTFIMAVAILGNLAVVIIVAKNKRMWTTTNFYMVNLAVSDLMVTLTCTWVHLVDDLTEGWILGAFFCKFDSFAQGKFDCSVLHIFFVGKACSCE